MTLRTATSLQHDPDYAPGNLLDVLIVKLKVKNDRQLSMTTGYAASQLSRIRSKKQPISAEFLLMAHEETGMSIAEMRQLIGDTKSKYFRLENADARTADANANA